LFLGATAGGASGVGFLAAAPLIVASIGLLRFTFPEASGRVTSIAEPSPASEEPAAPDLDTPLARYGRDRQWRVVHERGIVREAPGFRVSVEHTEGRDARLVIDTDAEGVDLATLKATLAERVPSATAARVGPLTRIEVPQEELEPSVLDDAVDAVATARDRERGAYR
jgi:hypothetical protein